VHLAPDRSTVGAPAGGDPAVERPGIVPIKLSSHRDSQDRGLYQNDILPRQAQDEHRENSKQGSQDRVDELRDGREVAIRSEIQAVAQKWLPIPPSLKLRVEDLERSV
jgi:hypothetical protein